MADLVRFVFSIGGFACVLIAGSLWLVARPTSTAARRFIFVAVFAYAAASTLPITLAAARLLVGAYRPLKKSDVPPGTTAVVLLGSGSFTAHDWRDGQFSTSDPSGLDRVVETARVYKLLDAAWVISSGGAVGTMDPNAPGGSVMRDELVQLGVPAARILVETKSKTTRDEAVIVAGMLKPLQVEHIVLVTSDIHMRRSVGTFRAAGLETIPAIARSPRKRAPWNIAMIPSDVGLEEASAVTHEVVGIGYYGLRGWFTFR